MNKLFDRQVLIQLAVVFAVMLSVKWMADRVELIGAGSIAIWCAIITATLFMKREGLSWKSYGLRLPKGRGQWLRGLGLALLAVVSVILFMALVLPLINSALGIEVPVEADERFRFLLGKPYLFVGYLVVVIWFGAALGEELLMRGFVLNRIADFLGGRTIGWFLALVIHAVIFGLMHAYQGVPGMISTGVVALIFGVIYLISKRSFFPVVLGHGLINTISLTGYYLTDGAMT